MAPRLLWHEQAVGWNLLAFEYIALPDLPRVIGAMHRLAAISCPDLPVKTDPAALGRVRRL